MDQSELAAEIGVSRAQLSSVEIGRVALKTQTALRLAEVLKINLMWLADGIGDQKSFILPPARILEKAEEYRDFKKFFDSLLRGFFFNDLKEVTRRHAAGKYTKDELRIEIPLGKNTGEARPEAIESAKEDLFEFEAVDLKSLPEAARKAIQKQILICKSILGSGNLLPALGATSYASLSNSYLTDTSTTDLMTGLQQQLPNLRERLNRATSEVGKMSALADFLGKITGKKVPLASVSRWLSGKREPGGEITLALLQWVEQQERQK